jgi:isopenicillin N synthase-like dioxygenase
MDSSTAESRAKHLRRVAAKMDRLIGKAPCAASAGGHGMIPVLDFTRFSKGTDPEGFVADLGAAARGPGFFLLKGHGIDRSLQAEVFALADSSSPSRRDKEAVSILKTPHYRGWAHDGLESLDETSGLKTARKASTSASTCRTDDPRVIAGEPFRGVNQWPDLPGFRDTMLAYYDAALDLGIRLSRAIALDLGLPEDHFDCAFHDPLAALRVLHYPPATGADGEIGAGAHSDYGVITLLMTDGEGGAAGQAARRRLDGRAPCARRLRGQYRRLPDALDERHLRLDPAPGAAAETADAVGRHVRGGASRRDGGGVAGHRRAEIRADPRGRLPAEPPGRDL